MTINDSYSRLTRNKLNDIELSPKLYVPAPTDLDYKRGYIRRYFVQKSNDKSSPIFEVDQSEYTRLSKSAFFTAVTIKWRITGPFDRTETINGLIDNGVRESNQLSINLGKERIKKLDMYIVNFLQFHEKFRK